MFFGGDLLAVLPTGFGKSMIFQILVLVASKLRKTLVRVLVICPLKSIMNDQIIEAESMGIPAGLLSSGKDDFSKYQLLFGAAEEALDKEFLSFLKNDACFRDSVVAVIVDESHTIETWATEQSPSRQTSKKKEKGGFREAFGQLGNLRSFFQSGTPMGAVTGTADTKTQQTINNALCLQNALKIFLSPNRPNLRFFVKKVKKKMAPLQHLDWLVEEIKVLGKDTPKTMIFCNTLQDIATVVNYMICKLHQLGSQDKELIGIYHSNSWQSRKDSIIKSFKEGGAIRVVVASSALCMGINFPDVRYIVNWGPARSIVDQMQQAGRAGRDGNTSHVIIIYYGEQLAHCEKEIKDFVKSTGCLRVSGYCALDPEIQPAIPAHTCCSNCAPHCNCLDDGCCYETMSFERPLDTTHLSIHSITGRKRTVSTRDKKDLQEALNEVLQETSTMSLGTSGFSAQLVADVVDKCEYIFTLHDITSKFPVFSISHSLKILEIIQEIFLDIPYLEETLACFNFDFTSEPGILFDPSLAIQDGDMDELLDNLEV